MKKLIHNIRRQPEEVRRHILHILTFSAGIILSLLWVYSLGTNLTSKDTKANMNQDLKPLSAFKDNMIDGYKSIKEPVLNVEPNQ